MVRLSTIFDSELNQRMFLIMGDLVRIVATNIELDANKYTGKYKESVTLTATVTDKDSNPVGGVTVSFYNMNSRIGTSITNSNGVATFNYELTRDLSANARVDDLTSNTVGIELIHDYNMDVVLDKSIIQTGETATFTTTLTDNNIPLSGENITYTYNGITEYVTTLDGEAKLPYTGTGKGDVEFVIKYGTLLQETFVVQDCHYWNNGSSVTGLEIGTGVSCTSNGDYITITTSTSGEKDVKIPVTLTGNWEFETELADLGTTNDITFKVGSGQQWGATNSSMNRVIINFGGTTQYFTKTINVGSVLKITYNNGTMTAYWNNDQLTSETVTVSGKMGYYTNSGRVQKIKNIKLKAL